MEKGKAGLKEAERKRRMERGCHDREGEVQGSMDGWRRDRATGRDKEGETSMQMLCMEEAITEYYTTKDHTVCMVFNKA